MRIYHQIIVACLLLFFAACTSKTNNKKEMASDQTNYYQEQYRPQFHFSPEFGWMNDPNGMVYYKGEYHLFYQYYPDSTVWGPMHWGHAVSTDLVHWKHLPIALSPDSLGYIFSGSAVVDWKNTTGFGTPENPPLVAIFTYHNAALGEAGSLETETQGIAYSIDKGRTWSKYAKNPVLLNPGIKDFRDPNVFWNEKLKHWNLVLSAHDHVQIYSSPNLKDWNYESSFGKDAGSHDGVWECPDLFPLKVDGTNQTKWVMIVNMSPGGPNGGSGTQYFVGDFDGHQFTAASKDINWLDWGHDNYAGVTWSDIPKEDGRRIFLGWMSNWDYAEKVPTTTWRSAMTVPRVLTLDEQNNTFKVLVNPVQELDELRIPGDEVKLSTITVDDEKQISLDSVRLACSDITVEFQLGEQVPDSFGITLSNDQNEQLKIGYSSVAQKLFVDRSKAGKNDFSPKFGGLATAPYRISKSLRLHIYIDLASVEVFADHGELVMTETFFPTSEMNKLQLFSDSGSIMVKDINIHGLKSIW